MNWFHDIRCVRLGASDLDASVKFATTILGLELVRKDAKRAYLRAGAGQDHHLVYLAGDAQHEALGFEASSPEALNQIAQALVKQGSKLREGSKAECDERYVQAMVSLTDPTGNRLELVQGIAPAPTVTYSRDAGITSFSHVGLRTTNAKRDEAFWTGNLGARVSDWIGDAPLLRIDEVHHRIALFPSNRFGVQHVNFQVAGIDDLMRSFYFLKNHGVKIVFGPGRHPTSSAMFLYFEGPDGIIYEYSTGVKMITDEAGHVPRHFPLVPTSFCMWGSKNEIAEFQTNKPAEAPRLAPTGSEGAKG